MTQEDMTEKPEETVAENEELVTENQAEEAPAQAEVDPLQSLTAELAEMKDKYVRLVAEFENARRRNAKERIELISTANKDLVTALLPVVDDILRAQKTFETTEDLKQVIEGVQLIFHKFSKTLESKGLKPLESIGKEFDVEVHEAITQIPAPSEDLKGKVVDEIEKGYYLNDKLIRFAKVVTGI
ncbi:MAG: nucleotide exchange factor GrpE [Cytophagales bacterium]|nr:nucleotide exchange factor GrpE [Cytophagales bacterium]